MSHTRLFQNRLHQMGLSITEIQMAQFDRYLSLLLEWNQNINLTAITDPAEVYLKHFADSVSIASVIGISGSIIDVGTGAGFPGLPLKILFPDLSLTLLDSLQKRVRFLETVSEELGLSDVICIHARAEDAGHDPRFRDAFDCCVSRAVAQLPVLTEFCLPFVKPGGAFLALKGPDAVQEAELAQPAISALGGELAAVLPVSIPKSDLCHTLVHIKKMRQTPPPYPRKAGKPAKKPLL